MLLQRTEKDRVCFGRSEIHGWGLFARRNIVEGEMVIACNYLFLDGVENSKRKSFAS